MDGGALCGVINGLCARIAFGKNYRGEGVLELLTAFEPGAGVPGAMGRSRSLGTTFSGGAKISSLSEFPRCVNSFFAFSKQAGRGAGF